MAIPTLNTFTSARALKVVTLSANIASNGGETVTATGFEIGVSSGDYNMTPLVGSQTTGTFTANATLAPGTYYARAFATNVDGTAYTSEISFTVYGLAATITDSDPIIEQVLIEQLAAGYDFAGVSPSTKSGKILFIFTESA